MKISISPMLLLEQSGRKLIIRTDCGVTVVERTDMVSFAAGIAILIERILREHPQ